MREENQTADIYRLIRSRIFDKQIPMGSKINQGRLAEEFGVSRTPVVKALHKLETEGLVDNIPQKGFSVHRLNIKELADLYAVLEGLNGILFPDIIEVLNTNHIKRCEKIFAPFNNSWSAQTREKYILADKAFHNFLWNLCQNQLAKHIYSTFEIFNRAAIGGLLREPAETLPEHLSIIAALKAKDVESARDQMVRHFAITRQKLQSVVAELTKLGADPSTISVEELSNNI